MRWVPLFGLEMALQLQFCKHCLLLELSKQKYPSVVVALDPVVLSKDCSAERKKKYKVEIVETAKSSNALITKTRIGGTVGPISGRRDIESTFLCNEPGGGQGGGGGGGGEGDGGGGGDRHGLMLGQPVRFLGRTLWI